MRHDPPTGHSSTTILELADQMVVAGVGPIAAANEIALGLGQFLAKHFTPSQAAALLREQAGKIDPPERHRVTPDERELLELNDKAQQFINTLQIAGIEEPTAVSTLTNACILRVARTKGAAGAAGWLRRLAVNVDEHGAEIQAAATAH